jgi:7-cyano-7-deazaguanine synthase in queuosine biosynthesis
MKNSNKNKQVYSFIFGSIMNQNGSVRYINNVTGDERIIDLRVDDTEFGQRIQQEFPSIIADLIDLAVAIHAVDRLTVQDPYKDQTSISVVLPVRNPDRLNTSSFQEKIVRLLEWATGSRWEFDFQQRLDVGRVIEYNRCTTSVDPYIDEVALWSGGLDALAGLYTRLKSDSGKTFMLFGSGSNNKVFASQRNVFRGLLPSFPSRLNRCQIPIHVSNDDVHRKNSVPRARGIVFLLLGSACAYLMGQKKLNLYENGVGAINLPYSRSEIGLDHSRSVHPLTLQKTSDLLTELFGEKFQISNPFLFLTKAEMCRTLAEDRRMDLPALTKSCDSPHRKKNSQCGYCSSCLLRRQALAATPMQDGTSYVMFPEATSPENKRLYFDHMLKQVSTLQDLLNAQPANLQWPSLAQAFPELDNIVDQTATIERLEPTAMRTRLISLYQNYILEWNMVESQISEQLFHQPNKKIDSKILQSFVQLNIF